MDSTGAEARLGQRLGRWPEMGGNGKVQQFSKPSLGREGRKHRIWSHRQAFNLGEITQPGQLGEGLFPILGNPILQW